jgi:hypothetical protein
MQPAQRIRSEGAYGMAQLEVQNSFQLRQSHRGRRRQRDAHGGRRGETLLHGLNGIAGAQGHLFSVLVGDVDPRNSPGSRSRNGRMIEMWQAGVAAKMWRARERPGHTLLVTLGRVPVNEERLRTEVGACHGSVA